MTTDLSLSAKWIVKHYEQRPEIEQDYEQLKSGGWLLQKLSSTRYSQIVFYLLTVVLSYSLYQLFANTAAGSHFAGKTRQAIAFEQLKTRRTNVIVYAGGYFEIFETLSFVYQVLKLSPEVQIRLRQWLEEFLPQITKRERTFLNGVLKAFLEMGIMNTTEVPDGKSSARFGISRRMALILAPFAWLIAIPLGHGVVPWAISLLTTRQGWMASGPGIWNLLGGIPIVAGAIGLIWIFGLGISEAAKLPERIGLDWSPKLLLRSGPYAFTRNPMYVAEMSLWFGWAIFFGSLAVLLGFAVLCVLVNIIVRREERDLETQFGEGYRQYKAAVPRWLGKVRR